MVFTAPAWVDELPFAPPDSIPIPEFLFNEEYGRRPFSEAKPPFACGLTGVGYSASEVKNRVDDLAKGMAKEFGWKANEGSEWDKVINIFSVNTVSRPPSQRSRKGAAREKELRLSGLSLSAD
jgi:hypothetical protein